MITKFAIFEKLDLSDIITDVSNINADLMQRLIDGLSFIGKKRKQKSLRIKKVSGFFHDNKRANHKNKLEIETNNGDDIEAKLIDNNIVIKINDELVYDIEQDSFNQEVFIDKIISEYKKYLKDKKWKI